ncbi:hypothetical protein [Rhizobium sp. SGZ-381]|uniref:hypothetical protein n=1 Tax=Rhizobium sp. SGZ-381 TaxID=3342800 RepID=UPI00366FE1B8
MLANLDPLSRRFEMLALADDAKLAPAPEYTLDERQVARVIDIVPSGFGRN